MDVCVELWELTCNYSCLFNWSNRIHKESSIHCIPLIQLQPNAGRTTGLNAYSQRYIYTMAIKIRAYWICWEHIHCHRAGINLGIYLQQALCTKCIHTRHLQAGNLTCCCIGLASSKQWMWLRGFVFVLGRRGRQIIRDRGYMDDEFYYL